MNPIVPDQGAPAPQGQAPTADMLGTAHDHLGQMQASLAQMVQSPKLTKQDVFKSAADLIAKGIFSTPDSQMALIQQLTQLPDDEGALRQALGQQMLHIAQMRNQLTDHFGGANAG